jgi:transcriptional regulator of heat shock response
MNVKVLQNNPLTPRQAQLLEWIIRDYVQKAEPVSSKQIEEAGVFALKSATLRAEMNELEQAGYLEQPHTSAGRIPSDKAYRYFVDRIVRAESPQPTPKERRRISEVLDDTIRDPREMNKSLAQVLSELTEQLVITNIIERDDFYKIGLKSLFAMPEFREFERAFRMTSFFEEFEQVFEHFEKAMKQGAQVRIFIGHENPFRDVRDEAILVTEYRLPHNCTGSVTLIGPTRMDYERNIALLEYAAEELNKLA